jgi:isoleucyl-tRNA synthetase
MNTILHALVRLMAPILSFTADEIWGYMKDEEALPSVHADLFLTLDDRYRDAELARRWEDVISVRKEVTRVLELARKEKIIGHPLSASVTLGLSDELMEKLTSFKDQLRSIFIVSGVSLKPLDAVEEGMESENIPGLKVHVLPSSAPKCERCWIHDPSVGEDDTHSTLCNRCRNVLAQITG